MLKVNGLYGHIQRNNAKSLVFLASFVLLFQLVSAALVTPGLVRRDFALAKREGLWPGTWDLISGAVGEAFSETGSGP